MAKRKDSMKRHIARAFNHLDSALEQIFISSKIACEVDEGYDEVFSPIGESIAESQQMLRVLWESFWGEFPEDIKGYL